MGGGGTVTIDGCLLSERTWHIIQSAYDAAGVDRSLIHIAQGSWHHGSLSGTTHDGGGAFDIRIWNIPSHLHEPLVVEFRRRNVCFWIRDASHGGFAPHGHGIVRDEPGLSDSARGQVRDYDAGGNGLSGSSHAPDYHPRPAQHPIEWFDQLEDIVTPAEIQAVADAVWAKAITRPWDGKQASAASLIGSTHFYAVQGGFVGDTPATATTSPGRPTTAKQILASPPGAPSLSAEDVEKIAQRTADIIAARLAQ